MITGITGFKGSWLSIWLNQLGAEVYGFGLDPDPEESIGNLIPEECCEERFIQDIREFDRVKEIARKWNPEIVFHLAAQPIVGIGYREPVETVDTNVMGTVYLLEALREMGSDAAVIVVTSDKCYRNDDKGVAFVEDDPLGGKDPYSMSKAATELVVASWFSSFFSGGDTPLSGLATCRAGNVIGGGDYAVDRLVPDAVRAFIDKVPLDVRSSSATRPWQHVLESLSGYLTVGQRLMEERENVYWNSYNFGPAVESVRSVRDLIARWLQDWPDAFVYKDRTNQVYKEAARLSLSVEKAERELGWRPVWDFERTVSETVSWYRNRHQRGYGPEEMIEFSKEQVRSYVEDAGQNGIPWAE